MRAWSPWGAWAPCRAAAVAVSTCRQVPRGRRRRPGTGVREARSVRERFPEAAALALGFHAVGHVTALRRGPSAGDPPAVGRLPKPSGPDGAGHQQAVFGPESPTTRWEQVGRSHVLMFQGIRDLWKATGTARRDGSSGGWRPARERSAPAHGSRPFAGVSEGPASRISGYRFSPLGFPASCPF